jgi:hypothetical protein
MIINKPSIPFNLMGFSAFLICVIITLFLKMSTVDSLSHNIHIGSMMDLLIDRVVAIVVNIVAVTKVALLVLLLPVLSLDPGNHS